MAGVWKKTLTYLGLVEEDELDELDEVVAQPRPAEVRSIRRPEAVREVVEPQDEGIVRTIPASRASTASSIHKSEPKRFNEAREIADRFKDGIPVIMNLQSTDDTIARRLVDFASGLVYGLDGKLRQTIDGLDRPNNVDVEYGLALGGHQVDVAVVTERHRSRLRIYRIDADTLSTTSTTVITTNSSNCYFRSDATRMKLDVARMPSVDYYGNRTTGYAPVDLTRVDIPQQIENAAVNAADDAVARIRQQLEASHAL